MPQKPGLLEYLASIVNCTCLSDLHTVSQSEKDVLAALIRMIRPQEYPLRQWNDALEYLAQINPFTTAREARAALLQYLTNRTAATKPPESNF